MLKHAYLFPKFVRNTHTFSYSESLNKKITNFYEHYLTLSMYEVNFLGTKIKQNIDFWNPTALFFTLLIMFACFLKLTKG